MHCQQGQWGERARHAIRTSTPSDNSPAPVHVTPWRQNHRLVHDCHPDGMHIIAHAAIPKEALCTGMSNAGYPGDPKYSVESCWRAIFAFGYSSQAAKRTWLVGQGAVRLRADVRAVCLQHPAQPKVRQLRAVRHAFITHPTHTCTSRLLSHWHGHKGPELVGGVATEGVDIACCHDTGMAG